MQGHKKLGFVYLPVYDAGILFSTPFRFMLTQMKNLQNWYRIIAEVSIQSDKEVWKVKDLVLSLKNDEISQIFGQSNSNLSQFKSNCTEKIHNLD